MQDNSKMASQAQLNYLRKLGYAGDENITAAKASEIIQKYTGGASQPQYQTNQYQGYQQQPQPNQYQQQAPTNAPMVRNNQKEIITRAGESIAVTPQIVEQYLGVKLTDPEFNYFFSICNLYGLNPFIKDIYPIKFGTQPATFVIDYKVMQQAADQEPSFDGLKVGLIFLDSNGNFQEREGAFLLPNEKLIGAWCDVFRKDRTHTNRTYALYDENVKRKGDGSITTMWKDKPVFMITKVAKAQALRETFPNMFSNNTYTSEEMDGVEKGKNADFQFEDVTQINKAQQNEQVITPNLDETPIQQEEEKPSQDDIFAKHLGGGIKKEHLDF